MMRVIGYTFDGGYCLCDDCCPDDSESSRSIFPWDEGASRMYCDNCLSRLREPLTVNEYDVAEVLKEIGCPSLDPKDLEASFRDWLELQPEDLDASDVDWTEVADDLEARFRDWLEEQPGYLDASDVDWTEVAEELAE